MSEVWLHPFHEGSSACTSKDTAVAIEMDSYVKLEVHESIQFPSNIS